MKVAGQEQAVRGALQSVLDSKYFCQAESLSNLLRYLVEEALAGRDSAIKELTVGIDVFGRGASFDPKTDGIVRVQASRLRAKLREYYAAEGQHDDIVISVPAGAYLVDCHPNGKVQPEPPSPAVLEKPGWPSIGVWAAGQHRYSRRALAALGVAGAGLLLTSRLKPPAVQIASVAVLPFRNLTGDAAQDYLADGLTDSLITSLGKLPGLRVVSRTTSMSLAGTRKPLAAVARELQVDTLVEGSMTRNAGNIRVNVNLLEVRERERNLYSQTLEHGERDFAGLQDAMQRQVAAQIQPGAQSPPQGKAHNPDAYAAYLKGRHWAAKGSEADFRQAVAWYEQAAQLDPQMALAKSGRAHAYIALTDFYMLPAESLARAKADSHEAVRIDPTLADAYVARGAAALFYDRDAQAAETDLRRALQMNPNAPEAHTIFAVLCASLGRFDEGVAGARRAVQLDPLSPGAHNWLQFILLIAARYEEVEVVGRAALHLFPGMLLAHLWIGSSMALRGDHQKAEPHFEEAAKFNQIPMVPLWLGMMRAIGNDKAGARAQLAKAQQIGKSRYLCPYEVACVHAVLGEMDEAYRWMERGLRDRCLCFTWLMTEPWLKPLRADPRFPALAAKVGLWNKPRSF